MDKVQREIIQIFREKTERVYNFSNISDEAKDHIGHDRLKWLVDFLYEVNTKLVDCLEMSYEHECGTPFHKALSNLILAGQVDPELLYSLGEIMDRFIRGSLDQKDSNSSDSLNGKGLSILKEFEG